MARFLANVCILACFASVVLTADPDPIANDGAIVLSSDGHARFTILTDRLIRMEFSQTKSFEDRPTLAFVNRKLPVPTYTTKTSPTDIIITTENVTVRYVESPSISNATCKKILGDAVCDGECGEFRTNVQPPPGNYTAESCCAACSKDPTCNVWIMPTTGQECWTLKSAVGWQPSPDRIVGGAFGGFTNDTLQVSIKGFGSWSPGDVDTGNLFGTAYSLDGITGGIDINCTEIGQRTDQNQCSFGPISRNGWAVFDDSANLVVDPQTEWTANRTNGATDYYIFAHGHDYKGALKDYSLVLGKVPIIPKFALGVWWSRYWPYTTEDLQEIASEYQSHSVPLDVLVSDMAWHYHNESAVEWGGYSWGPELFPTEPAYFLSWAAANSLNVTLNLHLRAAHPDADRTYSEFAKALGIDPSIGQPIPSATCPPPYNKSVYDLLVSSKVFADAYLDLLLDSVETNWWWLDDSSYWVARILYEHSAKRMQNGLAFARWGGTGSHRYPIGFSGDTFMEWVSLAFQPSFTAAAGNVMFWWSHDIGGHRSHHNEAAYDPELYLRWLQWGAHSPIMRTHPQPDPSVRRRPWAYALPFSKYMEEAFRRRGQLVPLIYTSFKQFESTGISPLHALYIDYPEMEGAYRYNDTYIFCDHLFVAPVTAPQDNTTEVATRSFWLPPGTWIDTVSGASVEGDKDMTGSYTLWETPVFVKAGSILPVHQVANSVSSWGNAGSNSDPLHFEVWHDGLNTLKSQGTVYLDSQGWVNATWTVDNGGKAAMFEVKSFDMLPNGVVVDLKRIPPTSKIAPCLSTTVSASQYQGSTLSQSIALSGSNDLCVSFDFTVPLSSPHLVSDYVGKRLRAHRLKAKVDLAHSQPFQDSMALVVAVNTGVRINANPASFEVELAAFNQRLAAGLNGIVGSQLMNSTITDPATAWLSHD